MKYTAEQLKKRFEEAADQPLPPNLKVTCACGKHVERIVMTDEDYQKLADILNEA